MILAFHSYKGGTGKTLLSVNLATMLANKGNKICLLDLDFRAPSLHVIFKTSRPEHWLNDYLNGTCEIDKVLMDCSSNYVTNGKIFVGLANPSIEAIREMTSKDRTWEMKALGRLLSLRNYLTEESNFDYVIFDTSPGLQYSSINAIISADVVFVVATPERSDVEGTQQMIRELYELFEKKTQVIANQVPAEFIPSRNLESKLTDLESIQSPIVGVIACSCDIRNGEGKYFLASGKPKHPFSKAVQEIAAKIEDCQPCALRVKGSSQE